MCGGKVYDEESCMLACPMDCHMSAWSDWGLCDSVCGSGLKNRTSKVRNDFKIQILVYLLEYFSIINNLLY